MQNGETIAACGCEYGIGGHSAGFWASLGSEDPVQIMASGGNLDWARICSIQHQSRKTHILAAIIKLLEVKFRCCTQLTTTGAIDNFNDCGQWTANQMEDARIFDMKSKFKEAGLKFTIKVTQDTS